MQDHALSKLKARDLMNHSGLIELKVKLDKTIMKTNAKLKENVITVQADAYRDGADLEDKIAEESGRPRGNFKLISSGRIIQPDQTLCQQNIKPGQTVMVVSIDPDNEELKVVHEQKEILNMARRDAEWLSDQNEFNIADQNGETVDIPKDEKKHLIIAMSLHEKGRASMKRQNYGLALTMLLEAMSEYAAFGKSDLLERVDNYALLNLDIAWCYLRIGNVSELPNAADRLTECEQRFCKTYGTNLERLKKVKGDTNHEAVLYMRMHLLQAIVAFHSGYKRRAVDLLKRAGSELKRLQVPSDLLEEVCAQGFTPKEARLALRATGNNPTAAVKHAQETKKKKAEFAEAEGEREKKRHKLGKTTDGSWVNLGKLKTLTEKLGYDETLAAKALRHTNNDMDQAIVVMCDQQELLLDMEDNDKEITKEMVKSVVDMGFDPEAASKALAKFKGNVGKAIEVLTKVAPDEFIRKELEREQENYKKTKEARKRVAEDIGDDEDHLDNSLEEEEMYLKRYEFLIGL